MMAPASPKVSVLVTVYNREKFLADCIESILASTWQDYEVVIVDDCSTDRSAMIGRSFTERDPRIRFFQNDVNLGDYPNRNRAASLAHGEFLKYLDADDLIYSHGLEVMSNALEKFPNASFALSCRDRNPPRPFPFCTEPEIAIRDFCLGASIFGPGPSASIIRRSTFEELGGFSGRRFIGDTELWCKLSSSAPVVSLPPSLVWWRRHEGQQMNVELSRPDILVQRFRLDLEVIETTPFLTTDERAAAVFRLKQHHARRLLALAIKGRKPGCAVRLARQSGLGPTDLLRGLQPYVNR